LAFDGAQEMKDLFQLLGLGGPFAAGAAIYALFNFLDKKASVAANQAIIAWMRGENYKQLDLATTVISAFDHLYGTSLLRLKSFMRSAFLSTCAVLIYLLFSGGLETEYGVQVLVGSVVTIAIPVIASDYLSLFFVRKFLRMAKGNVKLSIIFAFVCAILVITALCLTFLSLAFLTMFLAGGTPAERMSFVVSLWYIRPADLIKAVASFATLTPPAWLVHLWLPLFLVGAAINSSINAFLKTVRFAQWFIKRGNDHPFEAIGITAGVVTFIGAVLLQDIGYLSIAAIEVASTAARWLVVRWRRMSFMLTT
jgi:hypothetical protein